MEDSAKYEVPQEVLQALEEQLTDELMMRLMAFAEHTRRRLFWQGIRGYAMPEGLEAADVVAQIVVKILDGTRRWDQNKDPDLFDYMKSVVNSDMNHAATSSANQRLRCDSALIATWATNNDRSYFDTVLSPNKDPQEEQLAKHEAEINDRFLWGLLEDLEDDDLLRGIVEAIIEDVSKPEELAKRLGVKTKEIYNARKRLQRRVEKFRASWQAAGRRRHGEETPR